MKRPDQWRPSRRQAATGLLAAGFPMPAIAQAPDELSVGIVNASSDVEVFLAQKKGWFKDQNIRVNTTAFRSAADMVAPLGAGQLDVGGGAVTAGLYNSFARGIRLRAVADKASSQPGYAVNKTIVAKRHIESGRYKALADLKGMKLGNNGQGNTGYGSLAAVLQAARLNFSDVDIVELAYPNHVPAMQNGSLDASLATEPTATVLVRSGVGVVVARDDELMPRHAVAAILFSEKMTANRDLALRFLRAYVRSVRYYFGALQDGRLAGPNAEEIIGVLTEFTAIKDPDVYRSITPNGVDPDGRIDLASMRHDREVYSERGWLESNATVEQVVETSLIEQVVKELGPYRRG